MATFIRILLNTVCTCRYKGDVDPLIYRIDPYSHIFIEIDQYPQIQTLLLAR